MMDYQEHLKRMGKYEEPKPIEKEEPKKEIDWEQRRYEIAKEMFAINYAKYIDTVEHMAEVSVHHADILIEELKKTSECTN